MDGVDSNNLKKDDLEGNRKEAYAAAARIRRKKSMRRAMSGNINDLNSGDIEDLITNILETAESNNQKSGELKGKIEAILQQKNEINQQVKGLEREKDDITEQLNTINEKKKEFETQMRQQEAEYTRQNAELTGVINRIKQAIGSADETPLEDIVAKITETVDEIKQLKLSDNNHKKNLQELRSKLQTEINKLKNSSSGDIDLVNAIDTIIDEKKRIQEAKDKIETEYNDFKKEKADINAQKQNLDAQLTEKTAEIDSLKSQLGSLEARKAELQEALEKMQGTKENLQQITGIIDGNDDGPGPPSYNQALNQQSDQPLNQVIKVTKDNADKFFTDEISSVDPEQIRLDGIGQPQSGGGKKTRKKKKKRNNTKRIIFKTKKSKKKTRVKKINKKPAKKITRKPKNKRK